MPHTLERRLKGIYEGFEKGYMSTNEALTKLDQLRTWTLLHGDPDNLPTIDAVINKVDSLSRNEGRLLNE